MLWIAAAATAGAKLAMTGRIPSGALLKGLRPAVELENLPEEARSKHGCRVHDDLRIGCPALYREGDGEDAFLAPRASQQIAKQGNAPKQVVDAVKRNIGSGERKNLTVEVDPPLSRSRQTPAH